MRPLAPSQLERLRGVRALCEVCRTVRNRRRTWILRHRATGHSKQVGSSCLKPLAGVAAIETALLSARLRADVAARLSQVAKTAERQRSGPGEPYIGTTTFLAVAAAVIRERGWHSSNDPEPTWREALGRVETDIQLEPADLSRARDIRAWAASPPNGAEEYRVRLQQCLAQERLSSRELALAASAVRTYNRHLYWAIRRARARSRADPVRGTGQAE